MTITFRIEDFVAFDDFEIERTVSVIPSGAILQTAWFTVKKKFTDDDANAIISKIATSTQTSGGWIEDTGADGTGLVHFYLTPSETGLLVPYSEYPYSIKTKLVSGIVTTPESGLIVASPAVRKGVI